MEGRFDRWLLGAAALVVFLVLNAGLMLRNVRQLNEEAGLVTHTHQVRIGLERVLSVVRDAETGQRGYLITGQQAYLDLYTAAVGATKRQLAEVERLIADDPRQQARFPELSQLVATRLAMLDENVAVRKQGDLEGAREVVLTGRGLPVMVAIRDHIGEMVEHESGLLRERAHRSARTFRTTLLTGLLSALAAIAGVIGFMLLLRRHLAARVADAAVIAEQAERLRTTLASIGDGVLTTDVNGIVTNINAVAEALTGWTREAAIGRPLMQVFRIVNEETREPVESPVARSLREGVIVGLANHTLLIARDGTERPIDDSAAPIRCKEGTIVGCVLVFRDGSEKRKVEDTLREADQRKDEFLAMLAHELRNPLAPINNALQVLQRTAGKDGSEQQAIDVMGRQIAHMVRLVDDLLDVSRISRGKVELERGRVELASVIHHAIDVARPFCERLGQSLAVTLPPEPIVLDGDPTRLAQVIGNLLNNACKFSPRGAHVELSVELEGSQVAIRVRDNGIGLAPEERDRIFEMFTQVDTSLERSRGGLGIGLPLVKSLVEMHGGTVEVTSPGLGLGSEFVVRLPTVAPDFGLPERRGAHDGGPPVATTRRRILVVDDNKDAADSLAILLELGGHEVHVASDGLEAVEAAARHRPDVVLLDIGLPKLNGYEAARRIREQPGLRHVTLVALTGWGQDEDRRRSVDAGFDVHMVKPVDHEALTKLLAELTPPIAGA